MSTEWSDRPAEVLDDIESPKNAKGTVKRLLKLLMKQKWTISAILFLSLTGMILFAITPLFLGMAIDRLAEQISEHGIAERLPALANAVSRPLTLFLGAYLLSSLLAFVEEYFLVAGVGETLTLSLRRQISEKIARLPLRYYDSHKTGDLLSRTTNDLDKIAEVLKVGFMQFSNGVFGISITVAIMLYLNPLLTLLILAVMSLSVFATKWISAKNLTVAGRNQAALGEMNGKVDELYTGNLIIKSFNRQKQATETFRAINTRLYFTNKQALFVLFMIYPAIRFLTKLGFVVTAIAGGILVVNGGMTIGIVQAYLQYVNQISDPIAQSSYFLNSFQAALAAAERVFEFLDEEEEIPDAVSAKSFPPPRGAVEFEHIRFGYRPDALLMHDVNLSVRPNEMVAIVGPTGAGKTTLVNLLMRFYELNSGRILIDGTDIREMPRSRLRRMVGMVLQDTWLFKGTIAENIAYGKMDATRKDIIRAAEAASCDHFIRTLPDGYDTLISSEDGSISQGQMQLLTIARAILAAPALMILDEATSSVDTRTEAEVQKAMAQAMRGKTSFVIAHRLSTIRSADIILVMKDGTIIEKGTHRELLAGDTFYADLYNSQFAGSAPA